MAAAMSENTSNQRKPFHEMSLEEYAATEHSQRVPRWSILSLQPETYKLTQLCQIGKEGLDALAFLWGIKRSGSAQDLAGRIIRRVQFRSMLAQETEKSLSARRRADLTAIAKEAGVYHPWLSRQHLARCLISWREDARRHAKTQIAATRHERIVTMAARKGMYVPPANLLRYSLDATGHKDQMFLGVPLSYALRTAPEAIQAARALTASAFRDWVKANPNLADRLVYIRPGILADGGDLLWRGTQNAFAPPAIPPLFAKCSRDGE